MDRISRSRRPLGVSGIDAEDGIVQGGDDVRDGQRGPGWPSLARYTISTTSPFESFAPKSAILPVSDFHDLPHLRRAPMTGMPWWMDDAIYQMSDIYGIPYRRFAICKLEISATRRLGDNQLDRRPVHPAAPLRQRIGQALVKQPALTHRYFRRFGGSPRQLDVFHSQRELEAGRLEARSARMRP